MNLEMSREREIYQRTTTTTIIQTEIARFVANSGRHANHTLDAFGLIRYGRWNSLSLAVERIYCLKQQTHNALDASKDYRVFPYVRCASLCVNTTTIWFRFTIIYVIQIPRISSQSRNCAILEYLNSLDDSMYTILLPFAKFLVSVAT